jgi:hypothetical protein
VGWGPSAGTGCERSGGGRIVSEEGDASRKAGGRSRLGISGVGLGLTASGESGVRGERGIGDSVPDAGVGGRLPDGVGDRLPDGVGCRRPVGVSGRLPQAPGPTGVPGGVRTDTDVSTKFRVFQGKLLSLQL